MRHLLFSLVIALSLVSTFDASAATVDGIPIHSASTGSGSQTVIFVHGWTCDSTSWTQQVPALSARYRVVTLDLPGHGKSGSPKDGKFSMHLVARAVEAVRAEVKADKVVLVGHSMGTPVIRQYARLYPQRVAGLVIVDGLVSLGFLDPPPGGPPPIQPSVMGGPEGLKNRENFIRSMFTPATPPPVQQQILKMMLAAPEATATGAMAATFDRANYKDDVMTMPVVGLYAEKSELADVAYSKKIFPKFEYAEIPGTGHFLMLEKPHEFNRLLMGFLEKVK